MATPEHHHPLPAPPPKETRYYQQQQQQPLPPQQQQHPSYQPQPYQQQSYRQHHQQQPTVPPPVQKPHPKSRTFSFRSDKSQKSAGSHSKHPELIETTAEKETRRLHSKADPRLAMSEAEPAEVQANSKTSLAPLRNMQHRDAFGNPIADPDKSNPTRSRWERPLDTIRSFEAAIDGNYNQRKSYIRSDSESAVAWNRRNSHYGGPTPRFPQESYYGRPQSSRPESMHFDQRRFQRDSYIEPGNYGPGPGLGPGRHRAPRMQSEPHLNGYARAEAQNIYPLPNKDRSYETVTSAAASGSSAEQAGYHTDPTSSDNSSIDRVSPGKRPEPVNDYGIGFSQPPTYQPPAFNFGNNANGAKPQANGFQRVPVPNNSAMAAAPPVPYKDGGVPRRPLPQQQQQQQLQQQQQQRPAQQRPAMGEKRKSWFARRFSRAS